MTNGMKWFLLSAVVILIFMMAIFAMVSSAPPSIPNSAQQRMDAYTDCLRHYSGWGSPGKDFLDNCKEISGAQVQ